MRHVSVISEHPIFTGFRGLTGCQRDPWDRGVTMKHFMGGLVDLRFFGQWWGRDPLRVRTWLETPLRRRT